jgi:hypothetical protein
VFVAAINIPYRESCRRLRIETAFMFCLRLLIRAWIVVSVVGAPFPFPFSGNIAEAGARQSYAGTYLEAQAKWAKTNTFLAAAGRGGYQRFLIGRGCGNLDGMNTWWLSPGSPQHKTPTGVGKVGTSQHRRSTPAILTGIGQILATASQRRRGRGFPEQVRIAQLPLGVGSIQVNRRKHACNG